MNLFPPIYRELFGSIKFKTVQSISYGFTHIYLFADGSLMYERVPNKPEAEKAALNNLSSPSLKRRNFEEMNGMDGKLLMDVLL